VVAQGLLARARELFRRKPKEGEDQSQASESGASSGGPLELIQTGRQAVRDATAALVAASAALSSARKADDMVPERAADVRTALPSLEEASASLAKACSEAAAAKALEGPVLRAWALGKAEVTDSRHKVAQVKQEVEAADGKALAAAAPGKLPKPVADEGAVAAVKQTAADAAARKLMQREAAAAKAPPPPAKAEPVVAVQDEGPDFSAFIFLFFVFGPIFGLVAFVTKDI